LESYRKLGEYSVAQMTAGNDPATINTVEKFVEVANAYATPKPVDTAPTWAK
jgi:hypothetical protein